MNKHFPPCDWRRRSSSTHFPEDLCDLENCQVTLHENMRIWSIPMKWNMVKEHHFPQLPLRYFFLHHARLFSAYAEGQAEHITLRLQPLEGKLPLEILPRRLLVALPQWNMFFWPWHQRRWSSRKLKKPTKTLCWWNYPMTLVESCWNMLKYVLFMVEIWSKYGRHMLDLW